MFLKFDGNDYGDLEIGFDANNKTIAFMITDKNDIVHTSDIQLSELKLAIKFIEMYLEDDKKRANQARFLLCFNNRQGELKLELRR